LIKSAGKTITIADCAQAGSQCVWFISILIKSLKMKILERNQITDSKKPPKFNLSGDN